MIDLLFSFFLIASAISTNKFALGVLSPIFFVGVRMSCAGIMLLFWSIRQDKSFLKWEHIKRDIWPLFTISAFTTFAPSLCKAYALKHLPSSKATLLGSCDPFVTACYAYLLWGEKITFKKFIGIMLGVAGITTLVLTNTSEEQKMMLFYNFSMPEAAALAAVCLGRYGWIIAQRLLCAGRYKPSEINGITMLASGIMALAASYATGTTQINTPAHWLPFILAFGYTVVVGNGCGLTLYASCLKRYSSTFVSVVSFCVPLFVSLIGYFILGEQLSSTFFFGGVLLFGGILFFYI